MSRIVKKISAPYELVAINGDPTTFTIGGATTNNAVVTIHGNLKVNGTSTSIDSTNTSITDKVITLNKGGTPASTTMSGIEIDRGPADFTPSLVWNEATMRWSLSNDGQNFEIISTQLGTQYLTEVFEDKSPTLGGNLDTFGFTISSTTNIVLEATNNTQVDSPLQLKLVSPPPVVPGYNVMYANVVAGGGTGVYVSNESFTEQELVSKRRAIVYSLIF